MDQVDRNGRIVLNVLNDKGVEVDFNIYMLLAQNLTKVTITSLKGTIDEPKFTWAPIRMKNNRLEIQLFFKNPMAITSNKDITFVELTFVPNIRFGNQYLSTEQQSLVGEIPSQLMNDSFTQESIKLMEKTKDAFVGTVMIQITMNLAIAVSL